MLCHASNQSIDGGGTPDFAYTLSLQSVNDTNARFHAIN